MINEQVKLSWEPKAFEKYQLMITKIPLFHREIAKKIVDKCAPMLAQERGSMTVEEQDIIKAFFTEVPGAFYSLMVRLFDEVKFDYKKYETN